MTSALRPGAPVAQGAHYAQPAAAPAPAAAKSTQVMAQSVYTQVKQIFVDETEAYKERGRTNNHLVRGAPNVSALGVMDKGTGVAMQMTFSTTSVTKHIKPDNIALFDKFSPAQKAQFQGLISAVAQQFEKAEPMYAKMLCIAEGIQNIGDSRLFRSLLVSQVQNK